jgi:hypothetical protein
MMVKKLDRPTPFSVKVIKWQGAKKADFKVGNLHARVYIMDKQARYLSYQIEGGTRRPTGTSIPVPTRNLKLNKYGNMIGGKSRIKRLLNKKDTFQGTINGIAGIWQRPKQGKRSGGGFGTTGQSGLKLLVAYENTVTYQPKFDFYGIGERSVRKNISIEMGKAIAGAVSSAK